MPTSEQLADSQSQLSTTGQSVYNRNFWLAYAANVMLVTANALTFHFAELVSSLGGTEQLTGSIIRTGLIGALLLRLAMGRVIDRYGAGFLWTLCSTGIIGGLLWFTTIDSLGWQLHAARVIFSVSLAGMFTCSIVYIQNQVPPERRTEVIGNLGSSGFVGMIIGSNLGDFILNYWDGAVWRFDVLFGTAAALALGHLVIAAILTWKQPHAKPEDGLSSIQLLVRYWPGPVVSVAIVMGVVFAVTTVRESGRSSQPTRSPPSFFASGRPTGATVSAATR
jgi:MFS family permease